MSEFPTVDFIHLCRDHKNERLALLANNLGLPMEAVKLHQKELKLIMEFVKKIDERHHKSEELIKRIRTDETTTFLGTTLHGHLASDLRSIILLSISNQEYQANVILRHFIETFLMSIWADLLSGFRDIFDYFLITEEWKPYRSIQRMTWEFEKNLPYRSIKEKLERIRLINVIDLEGRDFYREYFSNATSCDLILLLALPVCKECRKKYKEKINFIEFHLDPQIRRKGFEDKHAKYKTDFGYVCSFCGRQRLADGFARGIPDLHAMADMLVAVVDDAHVNEIRLLEQCYNHLSEEYVHFSTTIHPDEEPKKTKIGRQRVLLWGLEGVLFCINKLDSLMAYYFEQLEKIANEIN